MQLIRYLPEKWTFKVNGNDVIVTVQINGLFEISFNGVVLNNVEFKDVENKVKEIITMEDRSEEKLFNFNS